MKYLVVNKRRYRVRGIRDAAPTDLDLERVEAIEVTDAVAETVRAAMPKAYFFDGALQTQEDAEAKRLANIPPVVPQVVAAWRIKAIAELQGLIASIDAAIEAITDPQVKVVAKRSWNEGNEISRTSGLIVSMASGLGLTETQLDEMFIAAAELQV